MNQNQQPEVWLRGPIPHIPSLLQPVAHALMQAVEELAAFSSIFPADLLWEKPSGLASVGFHLKHLSGVLDRLFTYARAESLNESQLDYLKNEGSPGSGNDTYESLLFTFEKQVAVSLQQLQTTPESELTQVRYVGRAMIPSTQLGLLFHAAEHTQRHVGQLLVTARILLARDGK
ncbi:DinB family protein [Dyadobacter aurulentus]|uniref:DinB family protein n=1 Tax=Dyadobacter sp. UC 10 TaxID=2605428 RepID=UPI0011F2D2F1|nr:DinB family protein [Dyadobacter sp. UC 10]KAA0993758.1 DinB family protein [Dyadobacter sp. UC 10]